MRPRKIPSKTRVGKASSATPLAKACKKRRKPHSAKLKRCVCMPLNESPIEFSPVWEELRLNGQLCDGVIRCDDGVEFNIHRAILSAVSPYFKVNLIYMEVFLLSTGTMELLGLFRSNYKL